MIFGFGRFEVVQRAALAWRRLFAARQARKHADLRMAAVACDALNPYWVARWLRTRTNVTIAEVLAAAGIPKAKQTQAHRLRVGRILRARGLTRRRLGSRGSRAWVWCPRPDEKRSASHGSSGVSR